MDSEDFAERVTGLAALADPIRRELYLFVAAQPEPVSRDRAADGVAVPRHTAKFHLDKLVEQGLLDTEFQRLSGRQGPGAGRPAKLYRRSGRELSVTLPARRYDLAGQLLARAIDDSLRTGTPVAETLDTAAAECGRALGDHARHALGPRPVPEQQISAVCAVLTAHGYEPRREAAITTLANCPFDALARDHTELVCGMNLALVGAVADQVGAGTLTASLDPADDRCCVVLSTR
jgi:predicted ArsR family transcriptional regulator